MAVETRRMRPLLGTFVEVGVHGDGAGAVATINAAFAVISRIERLLSFQDAESELNRLNRRCGRWVALSPDSLRVLTLARAMTRASGGRFNCTLGGRLVRCGGLPDHGQPRYLESGDAGDIELRPGAARLCRPVRVTLDGIAKGYAVDRGVLALKAQGAEYGWINAGGDLRVFGDRELPVQGRTEDGALPWLTTVKRAAMATSRIGGEPEPGHPALIPDAHRYGGHPRFLTVLAARAWRADALTKVAAMAPPHEAAAAVAALGGALLHGRLACASA
ncbi:MAG: FAD:protein FMN transferase [Lysobacterales bacterium]